MTKNIAVCSSNNKFSFVNDGTEYIDILTEEMDTLILWSHHVFNIE